jgi:hypothetical protein
MHQLHAHCLAGHHLHEGSTLYRKERPVHTVVYQRRLSYGTPTKRQVSKRLKRRAYKKSGLLNVKFTKCQVYKTSGLQNGRLQKKHPYILCTCGWWKSAGSVAAMFAGKVMAVFYSLF